MNLSERLKPKNILVIGDVMLDVYCMGEVKRISPEAPVPVFLGRSERRALGGAGNVAANLHAAGQNAALLAAVGEDAEGGLTARLLDELPVDGSMLLRAENRMTTVKTRFITSNHQVFRLDREETGPLPESGYAAALGMLRGRAAGFDLIVLSDYMKGMLSAGFTRGVIELARETGVRVLADVKDASCSKYRGAFMLTPNLAELGALTGKEAREYEEIAALSAELARSCACEYVLTTCGGRGMVLAGKDGRSSVVPSVPVEVFDVTGAGDTVIAYLSACLANGLTVMESVAYANIAAGIQVSKAGASPVSLGEVDDWVHRHGRDCPEERKIIGGGKIEEIRTRNPGRKIVFTNGCFDILHAGHARYLREAAKMGDILVVAVNGDASVRRLKGDTRPVNGENERAQLLAALAFVDYVTIFHEDTPYELIARLLPDVLCKGADYRPGEVVGRDIVERNGGRLELIPLVEGLSTSALIERLSGTKGGAS